MVRAEYYFIRNVCDPTKEQRKQIAREGERALQDAAQEFAEAQQKMMRGRLTAGDAAARPRSELIEEVLAKPSPSHPDPDQAARYQAEVERRAAEPQAGRRSTTWWPSSTRTWSSTPSSARRSASRCPSHWNDAWCQSLQMLLNSDHFFPNIPDSSSSPS